MKDGVTNEPKTLTELRRALNSRQRKIDKKKLPQPLAETATNAEIAAAVNKILEALRNV